MTNGNRSMQLINDDKLNDEYRALKEPMRKSQIDSLQAGRALAALAVVAHHSAQAAVAFVGPFVGQSVLGAGYLGVDFFFVLSGFIIYHSSQGKDLPTYAVSRLRRVYLPYLPVGIAIALIYSFVPQLSGGDRFWSWLPTITLLPVQAKTALSVAWTLKHEMFFYALFAAFYFTGRLAEGMALWTVAIIAAAFAGFETIPLALINLEFVFGILVAIAVRRDAAGHGGISPQQAHLACGSRWDHCAKCRRSLASLLRSQLFRQSGLSERGDLQSPVGYCSLARRPMRST